MVKSLHLQRCFWSSDAVMDVGIQLRVELCQSVFNELRMPGREVQTAVIQFFKGKNVSMYCSCY